MASLVLQVRTIRSLASMHSSWTTHGNTVLQRPPPSQSQYPGPYLLMWRPGKSASSDLCTIASYRTSMALMGYQESPSSRLYNSCRSIRLRLSLSQLKSSFRRTCCRFAYICRSLWPPIYRPSELLAREPSSRQVSGRSHTIATSYVQKGQSKAEAASLRKQPKKVLKTSCSERR